MVIMKTKAGKSSITMNEVKKIKTLKVNNLSFGYTKNVQVLKNINFQIKSGQVLSLLGPNGCGKTTLLNCIIGLEKAHYGKIFIDDLEIQDMSDKKLSFNIGYVPQTIIANFDYSVIDYVVCGCAPYLKLYKSPGKKEYERAYSALEQMHITHLTDKSYTQISGGEQQLACIARVLCQSPDFILLDEPTSHLDFGNQIKVLKVIKSLSEQKFGIIMTTHDPNHVMLMGGKTVMLKNDGNYIFGDTNKILDQDNLRQLYDVKLFLEESKNTHQKSIISPMI